MKTRRRILCLIFLTAVLGAVAADDGSWSKTFSVQGGSIYSETDHPDILLEKELLVFDGEKTIAYFQFRNTSNRQVSVDCGFPVLHAIQSSDDGQRLLVVSQRYGYADEFPTLRYFQTVQLYDPDDEEASYEYEGFLDIAVPKNEHNNGREFIGADAAGTDVSVAIEQDGKPVRIRDILLERHAGGDGLWAVYHFRHDLVFQPGAVSTVKVTYSQDLFIQGDGGFVDSYQWIYIIGTGATWKGAIGSFLFVKPVEWEGEPPGLRKLWSTDRFVAYGASNYEPGREDRYRLDRDIRIYVPRHEYIEETMPGLKAMWAARKPSLAQPAGPFQDIVRAVSASSFLPDKTAVFTATGVIENCGFGPVSAFDGLAETAWCESAQGDGLGEYVECELTKPVWGVIIRNGFTRFPASDWMLAESWWSDEILDDSAGLKDYFSMNNRVRKLEISAAGGAVLCTLELRDRRDPQGFAGIRLSPGRYRFTVRSVYPGTKWKDTCLGEILFLPAAGTAMTPFLADPFFGKYLPEASY